MTFESFECPKDRTESLIQLQSVKIQKPSKKKLTLILLKKKSGNYAEDKRKKSYSSSIPFISQIAMVHCYPFTNRSGVVVLKVTKDQKLFAYVLSRLIKKRECIFM